MFRRITASITRAATLGAASRTFVSFARPLTRPTPQPKMLLGPVSGLEQPGYKAGASDGPLSILDIVKQQRRFKSRGNTYQPSMLKRKRRAGFLARLRTRGGRKILERRRAKGRWFLTY